MCSAVTMPERTPLPAASATSSATVSLAARQELAEKLAAMEKERSAQLGHRKRPHAMADVLEYLLLQERPEDGRSLGSTRGAEPPSSARERQQVLAAAGVTAEPGESAAQVAAVADGVDHLVDAPSPPAVLRLEALLSGPLDVFVAVLDEAKQRGALGRRGR